MLKIKFTGYIYFVNVKLGAACPQGFQERTNIVNRRPKTKLADVKSIYMSVSYLYLYFQPEWQLRKAL